MREADIVHAPPMRTRHVVLAVFATAVVCLGVALPVALTRKGSCNDEEIEIVVDADGNGKISVDEYVEAGKKMNCDGLHDDTDYEVSAAAAHAAYDTDSDGGDARRPLLAQQSPRA